MGLIQQRFHHRDFVFGIRRIFYFRFSDEWLFQYTLEVGECFESIFGMIASNTAFPYSTKRKKSIGDVHDGIVDTTSAEGYFGEYFFFYFLAFSEQVQGKWF